MFVYMLNFSDELTIKGKFSGWLRVYPYGIVIMLAKPFTFTNNINVVAMELRNLANDLVSISDKDSLPMLRASHSYSSLKSINKM